jgi:nicotinamidase-related amidase
MEPPAERGRLLDADDSVLCVIDVQPGFLDKLEDPGTSERLVRRVAWIVALADALGVPAVVTEEEPERHGHTPAEIVARLPQAAPTFTKPVFGLADVPEILGAVANSGRGTGVLVGLEADVCVLHSALGLLDRGFRVAVVSDAVGSPERDHAYGLERMRSAGATLVRTKGLFYEWTRTVERASSVERTMAEVPRPDDLRL